MEEENMKMDKKTENYALIGFIIGLISTLSWLVPIMGHSLTIVGIIFSTIGLNAKKNRQKAVTGLILSIIFCLISFLFTGMFVFEGMYWM